MDWESTNFKVAALLAPANRSRRVRVGLGLGLAPANKSRRVRALEEVGSAFALTMLLRAAREDDDGRARCKALLRAATVPAALAEAEAEAEAEAKIGSLPRSPCPVWIPLKNFACPACLCSRTTVAKKPALFGLSLRPTEAEARGVVPLRSATVSKGAEPSCWVGLS